jgi:hypothetical protein
MWGKKLFYDYRYILVALAQIKLFFNFVETFENIYWLIVLNISIFII